MTQPATVDAGLESAKYLVTQGVLGIMCLVLMTTIILVFRMWMAERKEAKEERLSRDREWAVERATLAKECETEKRQLHEAHKSEMRENAKSNADLLQKTIGAIDRVTDLMQSRPS